ncbi:hypothetical protein [Bdellovibrio sp.]|uniref:hypothetical protein n=1 Tax=Bdellovibrio sp. TaxID=28201 RepID=UPI0039E65404
MDYDDVCPIWGTLAKKQNLSNRRNNNSGVSYVDGYAVVSPRVGSYQITRQAYITVRSASMNEQVKTILTTWILDQNRLGVEWPIVDKGTLESLELQRSLSVYERAIRLLKFVREGSNILGKAYSFYPNFDSDPDEEVMKLLAVSASYQKSEVIYLFSFLEELGFLRRAAFTEQKSLSRTEDRHDYVVTPKGYEHLEELELKNKQSYQAFVAMWFDSSMDSIYEKGLAAGIRKAGYEPIKIDHKEHNNKIDDEIVAEIRRSRFVVADFTQGNDGARGGVYYEAGLAHGLNLPVIFTCSEASISKVHFDTRQYNHITWQNSDDLRDKLAQRISATIGDGPFKNRS